MKKEITDPADLLPFSRDIIIVPGEVIPKNPLQNELPAMGKVRLIKSFKKLLYTE